MARKAVTFYSFLDLSPEQILTCIRIAEEKGIEWAFIGESAYRDAFSLASYFASRTSRIKFGMSIIPVYTRSPSLIAMSLATMYELSQGRLGLCVLGLSVKHWMQNYHGVPYEKHLKRLKEYVQIIRGLLAGGCFDYMGQLFTIRGYELRAEAIPVKVYLGVTGPQALALAGEVADGVILNSLSTPSYVKFAREKIEEGAIKAGRDPDKIDIGCSIVTVSSRSPEQLQEAARSALLYYLRFRHHDYTTAFAGFQDQAKLIRQAYWSGNERKALSLITDPMINSLAVAGTPDECKIKLKAYIEAGVDLLVIRSAVDKLTGIDPVVQNIETIAEPS